MKGLWTLDCDIMRSKILRDYFRKFKQALKSILKGRGYITRNGS